MSRLAGAHAVVTGGGTGIGRAIAAALAREGAKLTLLGRRREPLDETARDLPEACVAPADVTDREQVRDAFAAARDAHGPVTILVNNAGLARSSAFADTTAEAWREVMAVNLDALLCVTQAALQDLLAAPAGRVVNVASTAGLKGYAYTAAYTAAKHGAVGFTRALGAEFARTSLTVNAICPGFTDTDMVAGAVRDIRARTGRNAEAARAALARFNPQNRLIDPEEVAEAVFWLCLPASRSITGQAISVSGGEVA